MDSSKKIWGVFNTLDKQKIDEMSEFEIWQKIHSLGNEINCTLNYLEKFGNKDISIKALIDEQFNLEYLIYYTEKFGVEFNNKPKFGEHVKQNDSFKSWYNFWENHFKSMDTITYKSFLSDNRMGKDVSCYLPDKNWKETTKNEEDSLQLQRVRA